MSTLVSSYAPIFGGANAYSQLSGDYASEKLVIQQAMKLRGGAVLSKLLAALNGTAVGGALAATSYPRIQHSSDGLEGGARVVETQTIRAAGVTVAADKTLLDTLATYASAPTYPRNGDFNPRNSNGG